MKFSKLRIGSFGGSFTKRYLRKYEKLNEIIRKQVELGRGKAFCSTDESTDDTDLEEAHTDLATGVFCVITTGDFDFRSTLGSEAGDSLEQPEATIDMTSDRVEDRYADPHLNTGVEGTEELQRIVEGETRQNNVWMVERDSDDLWFRLGAEYNCVSQGEGPRKKGYHFSLEYSNDFGSRSEEVHGMPIVWYPHVGSASEVVDNSRTEYQLVCELHFAMMGWMGDVRSRREEFCQRGFCFNVCGDSMSRGTMWIQTSR